MPMSVSVGTLLEKLGVYDQWRDYLPSEGNYEYRVGCTKLYLDLDKLPSGILQLLREVLDQNWGEGNEYEIDFHSFIIPTQYIAQTLTALKSISSNQNDEILTMGVIATKLFLERLKANAPIPISKPSLEEAFSDFQKLKELPPDLGTKVHNGKKAVAHFIMEEQVKSSRFKKNPLGKYCSSSAFIGRILSEIKKEGCVRGRAFTKKLFDDYVPNQFKPYAVKSLIYSIEQNQSITLEGISLLSLCGGWGDRLVGALACDEKVKRYVETDPNKGLLDPKQRMIEHFKSPGCDVFLYDSPVQELTAEQLSPNGEPNGLVFYSPPYFCIENYNNVNVREQYGNFINWFHTFLLVTVKISYQNLKSGGYFAINLSNIRVNEDMIPLADFLKYYMEHSVFNRYFSYVMDTQYSETGGRFGKYDFDKTPRVFVYQTQTYLEPIPPQITVEHPRLDKATLRELHREISTSASIESVAMRYQVFVSHVIWRISDWDVRLTYDSLKRIKYPAPKGLLTDYNVCKPAVEYLSGLRINDVYNLTIKELHDIVQETTIIIRLRLGAIPRCFRALDPKERTTTSLTQFRDLTPKELKRYHRKWYNRPIKDFLRIPESPKRASVVTEDGSLTHTSESALSSLSIFSHQSSLAATSNDSHLAERSAKRHHR